MRERWHEDDESTIESSKVDEEPKIYLIFHDLF